MSHSSYYAPKIIDIIFELTVRTYKASLKAFLTNIYGKGALKDLAERSFKEDRNYESDMQSLATIKCIVGIFYR